MASLFEPALSTSRQNTMQIGPSMADQLPSINFGFDELRDRMAKFTAKFDAFIEQGRKRVLEERNQFRMNIAEVQGTIASSWRPFLVYWAGSTLTDSRLQRTSA
jgi:kinetochore protein Spc25, fungi type